MIHGSLTSFDGFFMKLVVSIVSCQNVKSNFSDLKCTIMEVKAIEGLGKAVDAILVNGRLKTNDIIVLGGQNGPICTHVKQIFTPPANKDQFNTVDFANCTVVEPSMAILGGGVKRFFCRKGRFGVKNVEKMQNGE